MSNRIEPAVSREWIAAASADELENALAAYEVQAEYGAPQWKRERARVTAGMLEAELLSRAEAVEAAHRTQHTLPLPYGRPAMVGG